MPAARAQARLEPARLIALCNAIGTECADQTGYVAIPRLLARFQTDVVLRPLLVEAMLAQIKKDQAVNETGWVVLVDNEKYPVSAVDIEQDSRTRPLPDRLRNTIAHELAHSLAYRHTEFGLVLDTQANTRADGHDFVDAVEKAVEQASPALLFPDSSVKDALSALKKSVTAADLDRIRRQHGISRYVLINSLTRVCHPTHASNLRDHASLYNVAIGLGEWIPNGDAIIRKWPLLANFPQGHFPAWIRQLAQRDQAKFSEIIPQWHRYVANHDGGPVEFSIPEKTSSDEMLPVRMSVERSGSRPGYRFLFAVNVEITAPWQKLSVSTRQRPEDILAKFRS